jgi:hypothetical protein
VLTKECRHCGFALRGQTTGRAQPGARPRQGISAVSQVLVDSGHRQAREGKGPFKPPFPVRSTERNYFLQDSLTMFTLVALK